MIRGKTFGKKFIIGTFLCCIMAVILTLYAQILQKELRKEVIGTLKEISSQSIVTVKSEIKNEFRLLYEVADRLSTKDSFSIQQATNELKKIQTRYEFRRMGIITPDGTTYATDDSDLNLKDRDFFKQSMSGNIYLSDKLIDRINGDEIIVYSLPLYEREKVCGVLFATYSLKSIQQLLSFSAFDGKGYSYIISKNGDRIVNTTSTIGFTNFENVFISLIDASSSNSKAVVTLKNSLSDDKTGYIRFHNKIDKYMYFSPLGIKDWYILNVVPTDYLDSTKNFVMGLTYVLCIILIIMFLFMILYIVNIERQKKKELSDILYIDDITGGYSFARFCAEAQLKLPNIISDAAYIAMDIDKFKVINELFGYDKGNIILKYIWNVWKKCSHENELFARRISDRFVAIWFFEDRAELNHRIENLLEELQKQIPDPTIEYQLKSTMGIYIIKDKREDVQNMMNYATIAHSTIKERGDISYAYYDDNFREKLLKEKLLEDQMRPALKRNEFIVYYQPKYNVNTKELVGAEALVRWKKPDSGIVTPGFFIPLAEKTGFVNHLDTYIFSEVCKNQKAWADEGLKIVPVSVNLSRKHLYNDAFMEEYHKIVLETGANPSYVQLELTESAIFENQEALCEIIDKLHSLGFQILMDDFGTGYSSLMMLKSVPIDVLKLDKSFVDDFDDPKGEKIITSVIKLAQELKIEVTAEGVETESQYTFLKDLGCNSVQGYYFARPMPKEAFKQLLYSQ